MECHFLFQPPCVRDLASPLCCGCALLERSGANGHQQSDSQPSFPSQRRSKRDATWGHSGCHNAALDWYFTLLSGISAGLMKGTPITFLLGHLRGVLPVEQTRPGEVSRSRHTGVALTKRHDGVAIETLTLLTRMLRPWGERLRRGLSARAEPTENRLRMNMTVPTNSGVASSHLMEMRKGVTRRDRDTVFACVLSQRSQLNCWDCAANFGERPCTMPAVSRASLCRLLIGGIRLLEREP